jgi:hypothetical protein
MPADKAIHTYDRAQMFQTARSLKCAAAFLAAALIILGTACAGDDGAGGASAPASSEGSPGPSASGTDSQPTTIDLGGGADVTTYAGRDATDLVNVSTSITLGDFNDDGDMDALIGAPQADGPDNKRQDAGGLTSSSAPSTSRSLGGGSANVTFFGAAAVTAGHRLSGNLNDDGVDDVRSVLRGRQASTPGQTETRIRLLRRRYLVMTRSAILPKTFST